MSTDTKDRGVTAENLETARVYIELANLVLDAVPKFRGDSTKPYKTQAFADRLLDKAMDVSGCPPPTEQN